jgi:O-antigen/teichoic acid export membrane protein
VTAVIASSTRAPFIARGTSTVLVGQLVAAAAAITAELVVSGRLGAEGRGTWAVLAAAAQIAAVTGALAIGHVAVREVRAGHLTAGASLGAATTGTIASGAVAGVAAIGAVLLTGSRVAPGVFVALVAGVVAAAVVHNLRQLATGLVSIRLGSASNAAERCAGAALVAVLVVRSPEPGSAVVAGMVASTLAAVVLVRRLAVLGPAERIPDVVASLRRSGARVAAGNLCQFVSYRLDVFLLAAWHSPKVTGPYALAATLGSGLWYLADAAAQAVYPDACSDVAAGRRPDAALRAAAVVATLTAAGGLVLAVAAGVAIPALVGDEFAPTAPLLAALVPGLAAMSYVKIANVALVAGGFERVTRDIAFHGAALTAVGGVALIGATGPMGAAVVSAASYGFSAARTRRAVAARYPSEDR